MTESKWNLVMDREGLTISGENFTLTTTGDDPMQMDEIVSGLQAMTRRTYGQYCGVSRAMEMVGERWGLLIVRDLLVGPKTVAELREGLPMIPAGMLGTRLRELERSSVIRHRDAETYELTEYGAVLKEPVLALARWGSVTLDHVHPEDVVTPVGLVISLQAAFRSDRADGVRFSLELHIARLVAHAVIADGLITAQPGPLPGADLVLEPGTQLRALLTGKVTPADALSSGEVRISGEPGLLERFVYLFEMAEMPTPENC